MKLRTLPLPRPAIGLLASLLLLAGCSVAPVYDKPGIATPAAFKEAAPVDASWKPAEPADSAARGEWWQVFGDPVLDRLEQDAIAANPDLLAAAARLGQARALEQSARAARLPQVGVGFGPTRQRPSPASQGLEADADTRANTLWRGQATIAYEVDLFGRLASAEEAARLDTERRAALFGATLLSLQADVAQAYFLIRELDAAQTLYGDAVKLRADTVKLLQRRFEEGDIAELDLARARREQAEARSESLGLSRQRALAEHALAILLGKQPVGTGSGQRVKRRRRLHVDDEHHVAHRKIRQLDWDQGGAQHLEQFDGRGVIGFVETGVVEVLLQITNPDVLQQTAGIEVERHVADRWIDPIGSEDRVEHHGAVLDRTGQGADLVGAPREGH
ncbi:MAG TPA: TolC family protein, partial [Zoogloea sp.]|nr:TolC family protein [Zoogloea sp.]